MSSLEEAIRSEEATRYESDQVEFVESVPVQEPENAINVNVISPPEPKPETPKPMVKLDDSGFMVANDLDQLGRIINSLSRSSIIPEEYRGNAFNILAAHQIGAKYGWDLMTSLNSIIFIKGRMSLKAEAMRSILLTSGECKKLTHEFVEGESISDLVCVINSTNKAGVECESSFSMADAIQARLSGDNWQKYPKQMLIARASTNHIRFYYPHVLAGMSSAEELQDAGGAISSTPAKAEVATLDSIEAEENLEVTEYKEMNFPPESEDDKSNLFGDEADEGGRII